eukprot:7449727-Alexandrium_andersonii.AAC.1
MRDPEAYTLSQDGRVPEPPGEARSPRSWDDPRAKKPVHSNLPLWRILGGPEEVPQRKNALIQEQRTK